MINSNKNLKYIKHTNSHKLSFSEVEPRYGPLNPSLVIFHFLLYAEEEMSDRDNLMQCAPLYLLDQLKTGIKRKVRWLVWQPSKMHNALLDISKCVKFCDSLFSANAHPSIPTEKRLLTVCWKAKLREVKTLVLHLLSS